MVFLRRIFLLVIVLALPVAMVALFYIGTVFGLHATNRTIDPNVLRYSSMIEYVVFLFVAILEARNRW